MPRGLWAILIAVALAVGCKDENRYELSKDSSGRTVRLDRRTGELAVFDGNQIAPVRAAAEVAAERATKSAELEAPKSWAATSAEAINARAYLATSWRDGKLFYVFTVYDLPYFKAVMARPPGSVELPDAKKHAEVVSEILSHAPYSVELTDANGFPIATLEIQRMMMIGIVDAKGATDYYETKGATAMSESDYRHVANWAIRWHSR